MYYRDASGIAMFESVRENKPNSKSTQSTMLQSCFQLCNALAILILIRVHLGQNS